MEQRILAGRRRLSDRVIDRSVISSSLGWSAAGSTLQAVIQLLSMIVLSRLVSPADFGLIAVAMAFIFVVGEVGRLGIDEAIVQVPELSKELCGAALTAVVFLGGLVTASVWILAPLLSSLAGGPALVNVLRVLSFCVLFTAIGAVGQGLMIRSLELRQRAIIQVTAAASAIVLVGIPLAAFGSGVWALASMIVTQSALTSLMTLWWARPRFRPVLSFRNVFRLLAFGSWSTLARILFHLASNVDYLIIGRILGLSVLGFYERAFRVIEVATARLTGVVASVSFPVVSRMNDDSEGKRTAFLKGMGLLAILYLPISCLISLSSNEVVRVLFGNRWLDASLPLSLLALGLYFRASAKFLDSLARGTGSVKALTYRIGFYFLMVAVSAAVGVRWGLRGVAVGVVLAMVGRWLLMCRLCMHLCSARWYPLLQAHRAALVLAAVISVPSLLVQNVAGNLSPHPMILLPIEFVVGISLGGMTVLLSKRWQGWGDLREAARGLMGHPLAEGGNWFLPEDLGARTKRFTPDRF